MFSPGKLVYFVIVQDIEAHDEGYSVAFVSQVFDHDKVGPSIVECLAFWVASAMGLPSTFEKTRVNEFTTVSFQHNLTY